MLHEDFKDDANDRTNPAFYWQYDYDRFVYRRFVQVIHNHIGFLNLADTQEALFTLRWGLRFPIRRGFTATPQFELDYKTDPEPDTKKADRAVKLTLGYQW